MSLLTFHDLAQNFAGYDVFGGLGGRIEHDSRIGLVGPNGVGKTSLLQILAGLETPVEGTVNRMNGLTVGYLRQEAIEAFGDANTPLIDEMLSVFEPLYVMERRLRELEALMDASHRAGRPMGIAESRQVLALYLFRGDDVFKQVGGLSGGERGRLALAMLALHGANLLLLDEPTNHLDIQAQEALEQVLAEFGGTILLVTHDRYLVERLATQIWRIEGGQLHISEHQPALAQAG